MGEIIIQGATLGLCIYLTIWTVVLFKGELDSSFFTARFQVCTG